jgi:hypothetical protein
MLAELYIVRGREAGKALELSPGSSVTFGRALSNDVRIRDAAVSRVHCRFECTEQGLRLKDMSGNGTLVNDDRIKGVEVAVEDGACVRLGGTEIRVLIESDDEAREREELEHARKDAGDPSAEAPLLSESTMDDYVHASNVPARTLGQPKVTLEELAALKKKARARRADVPPPRAPEEPELEPEEPGREPADEPAASEEKTAASEERPLPARATLPEEEPTASGTGKVVHDEDGIVQIDDEPVDGNASTVPGDDDLAETGVIEIASPSRPIVHDGGTGHLREVIPGYRIEAKLGGGGRRGTVVYRALQLSLDRPVALKVLMPGSAASERDLIRFLREAAAIARLHHPNVVTVHDAGRAGERRFIVMELLPGGSAADRIEDQGALLLEEGLGLGLDVTRALAYAHGRGIVHRSVRPANALRDDFGAWKLVDFGLSRDVLKGGGGETSFLDAPLEAVAYLAPEQVESSENAGTRSDVYAAGTLLYHALVGRPPFWGESLAEIAARIGGEPPLEPLAAVAPPALVSFVGRCLARDPAARYADGQALHHELTLIQGSLRTGPRPPRGARP